MKKIFFILLICITSYTYAQNLAFNRVIDTVLVLEIGANVTNISTKHLGATISPPNGKVWKINNILVDPGKIVQQNSSNIFDCFFCDEPSQDRQDARFGVDIFDGTNSIDIIIRQPDISSTVDHTDSWSNGYISYPLWINSNSSIRTFMIQTLEAQQGNGLFDICVRNVLSKAYVSIIEFNAE
tara:strand:- start:952 stop:1500 length:549 start_codon:yes stop_codon:yes gene_type:complete